VSRERAPVLSIAVVVTLLGSLPACAQDGVAALLRRTHWGETMPELLQQFGGAALRLRQPLDFGDSYAALVLQGFGLGGVPMVVFFQMDKKTRRLKRIQLERPPHGVNPPAFRAIVAALAAELGPPDRICEIPPSPAGGWQAAAEERWQRGDTAIGAIFRDTTFEAFEGCLFGPATGWCGLHGQILVRLAPAADGAGPCGISG
jgi:hypothetical protein